MTQIQEQRNLFEFDNSDIDICELDKTACFFCPSENGGENSFSTQMTDDTKETSMPATPEQDEQAKPKVKTFTLKRKVLSDQKFTINSVQPQDRLVSGLRENLSQATKSDAKVNHVRGLPILTPIMVPSQRGRTAPLPLTNSLEIKDFLITETGTESENHNLYTNFPSTTAKTSFYKSKELREWSNDCKLASKEKFIIKKPTINRVQIRNLNPIKVQNPIISSESQPRLATESEDMVLEKESLNELRLGKIKTKSLQINTEGDLETTSLPPCEYNLLRNARPFDFIKISNYTSQCPPQTTKHPTGVAHKKMVTFLIGNQEEEPVMRKIVAPKVLPRGAGVVKFNIVKKKETNQSHSEQNLEARPFGPIFSSDLNMVQKTEGSSREGFYVQRSQQERPRSRFKTQEVVVNRLFNMKSQ